MDEKVICWLTEGDPWLDYAVRKQLLEMKADPAAATKEEKIKKIINRVKDPKVGLPALKSGEVTYTSTGNAFWDLFFLSDIGLQADDIDIHEEVETFFELQQEDGTFVLQNGTKSTYFCIPSIILTSLVKMGYQHDPRILRFVKRAVDTQRLDGGWHCALSRATGKKLQDTESCPMDNLNILMLLGQYDAYRNDDKLNGAVDLLLAHWKRRMEPWRPYGFGIGDQYGKLKYPAVKYGILRVLDVLSLYPYAIEKKEFLDMLDYVLSKVKDGKYFVESVSRSYSEFDFGQTVEASRWITFLIYRIQKRIMPG